jgi:hypothetical protein
MSMSAGAHWTKPGFHASIAVETIGRNGDGIIKRGKERKDIESERGGKKGIERSRGRRKGERD